MRRARSSRKVAPEDKGATPPLGERARYLTGRAAFGTPPLPRGLRFAPLLPRGVSYVHQTKLYIRNIIPIGVRLPCRRSWPTGTGLGSISGRRVLRHNGVLRSSPINNRKLVLLRDAGPLRKEYGVVVTWQTDRCVVGRRTATCPPSRPGPATSPTSIQRALSIPFKGRI